MAHITTLTRAYNDLHNSQANTYSYSGSFETFKESEVKVKLNDTLLTYNSSPSDNTQYSVNLTDKTIHVGGGNLTSGTLSIYPETDLGAPTLKAPYTAGSAITANDLTNNQKQTLRKLMEHEETKLDNTGGTMTGDLTMGEDRNIIFEGATDDAHETTITVADPTADRTITFPNVSGNVVTTGDTGTVTSTMITNDTIVNADVNSSAAIAGTKISPNFGSQNITTTGNTTIGGALDVDGDTNLDNTNVAGYINVVGTANIDNVFIDGNTVETLSGNLTIDSFGGATTIDDPLTITGTTTLPNVTGGAVVTSGTSTSDTKVYSAKRAGEIFYGKDTVEEIQSGETWSSADDKVATTAAIDARIIDLVDDVGGFVPIANELSFPNANPDVNNGAGTLVSIKALSTAYTSNSSGEITINNGTVGNSTVTITGAGNAVTYAQTLGIIVETTSTLNTYAFHRQTPDATSTTAVANNATNINTVAGISGNVTTVAGISSDVTAVAGKATEVGRLGTAAAVEDMSILGTTDVVADMAILGTTDVVADMAILGTTDVVADMAILGTTDVVADLNTLGTSAIVADMDALADVATEIGRLGTADAVADMNTLGTADVVSDMNDLATSGNITAMNNCSGSITSINTAASNLTSIANFGDQYQVAANNPSTDGGGNALAAGDLYFNTSANELKVYNGSAWQGGVTATGNFAVTTGNTFTGDNRYNDNVKALFGTGSDLEIYHSGSGSYISDVGTGSLYIQGENLILENTSGTNYFAGVSGAEAILYHNGSAKLATAGHGINITGGFIQTGDSLVNDNGKIKFGDSSDLQIFHDSADSYLNNSTGVLYARGDTISLNAMSTTDKFFDATNGGAANLYWDGSKKLETTSGGATVSGKLTCTDIDILDTNTPAIRLSGTTDDSNAGLRGFLGIATGANNFVNGAAAGDVVVVSPERFIVAHNSDEAMAVFNDDGAVDLRFNGTTKFQTSSTGATITPDLILNNSSGDTALRWAEGGTNKFSLYQSSGTLRFYDNTNSAERLRIDSSGRLLIGTTNGGLAAGDDLTIATSGETGITLRSGQSNNGAIYFSDGTSGADEYRGIINYNHTNNFLTFYTDALERLRIDASGRLGLGVTPSDFHSNNTAVLQLKDGNSIFSRSGGQFLGIFQNLKYNSSDVTQYVANGLGSAYFQAAGIHKFYTAASGTANNNATLSEVLRIDSSGKVGIGETSMDALLVIKGDSDANTTPSIRLKDGSDTREAWITNTSGDLILANGGNDNTPHCKIVLMDGNVVKFATANTERMAVDSVGLTPSADSTYNIGSNGNRWANGYFDTLYGDGSNLTGINTDLVSDTSPQLGADLDTNSHHILIDDGHAVKWGNDTDLEIQHTGSYAHTHNATGNYIIDTTGNFYVRDSSGSDTHIQATANGAVDLYYDGGKKFETQSTGAKITNIGNYASLIIGSTTASGAYLYLDGDSDGDASGGDYSYIGHNTDGNLILVADNPSGNSETIFYSGNADARAKFTYDGHFRPTANNTYDCGQSSYRWRNIYTNDLNLSNEGGANDVDGTWGDWTIQEGESDLFLKNNRNGKKYKFNLTEVL